MACNLSLAFAMLPGIATSLICEQSFNDLEDQACCEDHLPSPGALATAPAPAPPQRRPSNPAAAALSPGKGTPAKPQRIYHT